VIDCEELNIPDNDLADNVVFQVLRIACRYLFVLFSELMKDLGQGLN